MDLADIHNSDKKQSYIKRESHLKVKENIKIPNKIKQTKLQPYPQEQ